MVGNKKIWYGLGLDNSSLQADANKSKSIIQGISNKAVAEGKKIDSTYKTLSRSLGIIFSTGAAAGFIAKIANVRGEFQQLEVAFTTMLGSKKEADELMARTVDFAAKTPFDLQGVANGTKQLLAYGSGAESVTDELGMLGNIASGLSIPLNDMVYLYGTTRTQGRLFTRDLQQFMGRGIPLAEALANQFGVTKKEVSGLVTAGKVGFADVEKALQGMTSEGGKFYNLMEEQSKTITGKMSNLGDGLSQMFNKMGESQEDAISGGLDLAISLVDNYQEVGKIIAELIATYGLYKAALITMNVVQGINQRMLVQQALAQNTLTVSQKLGAVATMSWQKAMKALNSTMLMNPYVAVAAAVAGLVYIFYKLATAQTEAEKAQDRVNQAIEDNKALIDEEKAKISELLGIVKDEVSTITQKQKALEDLQRLKPNIFADMDIEAIKTMKLTELNKQLNAEYEKSTKLSNQKQISANKAEIARQKERMDISLQSGGSGAVFAIQKKIEALEKENQILQKNLDLEVEIEERAKFNSLPDAEKIQIKEQENAGYNQKLKELGPSQGDWDVNNVVRDAINDNIKQNNILIQGYRENLDKVKDIPLQNRASVLKQIAEVEEKIKGLQKKSITNISDKELGDLEEYEKSLSALKKTLKSMTGETNKKKTSDTSNSETDFAKTIQNNERERLRMTEDLAFKARKAEIESSKTGLEKTLALNQLNYDIEIKQLERLKEDRLAKIQAQERAIWEAKNPKWKEQKLEQKNVTTELSDNENAQIGQLSKNATTKFDTSNQKAYTDELKLYEDFAKAYIDKKMEFDKKLQNLKDRGFSDDVIKETEQMQNDILEGLNEEMDVKEGVVTEMAEKIVGLGLEQVLAELETARTALEGELANGGGDKKKVAQMTARIKALEKLLVNKTESDQKTLKKADWGATVSALKDIQDATVEAIESFGGLSDETKNILSSAFTISSSAISMITHIGLLSDTTNTAVKSSAVATSEAIKGVEKASVILAIVGAAVQIISKIVTLISQAKDKKKEKEIERLSVQVKTLKSSYDALGDSIEKAYGSDAADLIAQQDENLKKQRALLVKQMEAEKEKKKSDDSKIQAYKDQIQEIDDLLGSSIDKKREAIIGEDIKSAIDEFADAYMNAWQSGEDRAKAMNDVVKDMVRSAVQQFISSRMSGEVTKFYEYLATAMEDGILTAAEKRTLTNLENAINEKMSSLNDTLDEYVVDDDESEDTREANTKGFASMSQDSADELNGRFTVIQGHTFAIAESMVTMRALGEKQLEHLAEINTNTGRLSKIEQDITSMKSGIDDMNTLGIKLR